jgi:hypothetical protein
MRSYFIYVSTTDQLKKAEVTLLTREQEVRDLKGSLAEVNVKVKLLFNKVLVLRSGYIYPGACILCFIRLFICEY